MGVSRFWFSAAVCGAMCVPAAASAQQREPERVASFPRCEMSAKSRERFNAFYGEARLAQIDQDHHAALINLHRAAKMCVEAELFHYMSKSYEALGDNGRALEFARAYEEQLEVRAHSARADRGDRVMAHREVARLERAERAPEQAVSHSEAPAEPPRRPERLDLSRPPARLFEGTRRAPAKVQKKVKRMRLSTRKRSQETRRKLDAMFSDDSSAGPVYTLESSPRGASVRVDGLAVGVTPHRLELAPGEHVVELSKPGWVMLRRVIQVRAGEPARLMWSMTLER